MTERQDAITVTRELDAPREEVWEAWTNPESLARWWWPARFHTTYQIELRVGGHYSFRTADIPGMGVLAVSGEYLEIDRPQRLVYTWRWDGQEEPPSRVIVDFVDRGSRTEVRIAHHELMSVEDQENHARGWRDCLDRLDVLLAPASEDDLVPAEKA